MNERPKPVYGMRSELFQQLEYLRWNLDEAKEAADEAQVRITQAEKALGELLSEEGPIFFRVRCESCRTSWMDERAAPTVTHCPSCGKKA
jgi:ribosomal protein S27E